MTKTGKSIYCGSILFILFIMTRNLMSVSNMLFYLIACVIFVLGTVATYLIFRSKSDDRNATGKVLWSILPIVTLTIWMILFYINETDMAPEQSLDSEALIRNYFSFPIWITITVVGVLICLLILRDKPKKEMRKCKTALRAIVAMLFSFGTAIQFYAPNIFQDIQGGTYHSHAYTNSIINACWLIPYTEHNQSLYGHYGILFMPVLKILHRIFEIDYLTGIFLVSAVVAGISILLYIWILNHFAEHDLIFYMGMFAVGEYYFMLMQGGVFLQVHPHRMIFPIMLVALALWEKKKGKIYNILAIFLITVSIVWSTEVGLVIMLAFSLYRWIQHIMDGEMLTLGKLLVLLRYLLLFSVIPFVMSYIIVSGYNVAVGGPWLDIKEFLFPLVSERGYISNIELPLPDATHAWIGASLLFLSVVGITLRYLLFPKKDEQAGMVPFYFLIGVLSLGLMIYYVNRPTEGSLFIVMFLMLILQAVILQKSQNIYMEWRASKGTIFDEKNRFLFLSLRVITTFILFVMAFDCIYSMPKAWKTSAETIWKRAELQEFADYIYIQVPPDAVAFGEGVPELLSMIDRDTHLHTTEWSYKNTPLDTMKKVRYEIDGEKWIFCAHNSLFYMQEQYPGLTDNYYLNEQFEYNGETFGFWVRNE